MSDGSRTGPVGSVDDAIEVIADLVTRLAEERERNAERLSQRSTLRRGVWRVRQEAATNPAAFREQVLAKVRSSIDDARARRIPRVRSALVRRTPPRQTYFLHIGAAKSGSTYLQSLLWANRCELRRHGVYVPGRAQNDHFLAGSDVRGGPAFSQAPDSPWRGAWNDLIDDAERSRCPEVVISNELLSQATPSQVRAALDRLDGHDVQIIYAVRDFAGLLTSVWQQHVQAHPAPPFGDWVGMGVLADADHWFWEGHDVGGVIDRWTVGDATGGNVLIVPSTDRDPDELWRRFRSIVGWNGRPMHGSDANSSLGLSHSELLRRIQERIPPDVPHHQRAYITLFLIAAGVLARQSPVDPVQIPVELKGRVDAESRRRREAVSASGCKVIGDLDDLADDPARYSSSPPAERESVMREAADDVIAELERHLAAERDPGSLAVPVRAFLIRR